MANAGDIIKDALQDIGVLAAGQEPTTADNTDCLRRLNKMLQTWSTSTLLVPFRTQVTHTLDGSESYTIGSGGDINTTRPTAIQSAFVTHGTNDYPVTVGRDRSQYDDINDKSLPGIPNFLYYEPAVPLGIVYVWYVGDASYTLTLSTRGQLTAFPDTTTEVDLAPGYTGALEYNLATRIAPMYEVAVSAEVMLAATESRAAIKRLNRQNPVMGMPYGIPTKQTRFNINEGE